MMKRLLLTMLLAAHPSLAAAQHAPAAITPVRLEPGVTLTLVGHLLPGSRGELMFPPAMLERLSTAGPLQSVDTAPVDGRIVLQVRFSFGDVGEFTRWYAEERTVRLLAELRALTTGGSFETYLSYRRNPAG